ncbi:MAG: hypothetical protein AB198_00090 [Parcubacteria bacterium C7867-003]|nr:MAG: hypothetical protein AB198_00090 [Parcubacteria bacterium C7867-003]
MTTSQKFLYLTLANIIFLFHLTFVFIVSLGWLIPSMFYIFLVSLIAAVLSEVFLGYCFLTRWEFDLRRKIYPSQEFDSSCIFHYGRLLFGLGPRIAQEKVSKNFFQKHSSLLIFLIPLIGSVVVQFI